MKAKDKVLDAALQLFLDNGYHGTSIKLIVEASKVSTGSVYHHFKNKEDIIKELYEVSKRHMNQWILTRVDLSKSIKRIIKDYWYARHDYNETFALKARFIRMYFNSDLVQSQALVQVNSMYDDIILVIKEAMHEEEIIPMDIAFFLYDLFAACDAVGDYFRTIPDHNPQVLDLAFKKYWRSIVKLDL